ncbi:MAG: RDD family protein [Gammaproteobacteria bacterium]
MANTQQTDLSEHRPLPGFIRRVAAIFYDALLVGGLWFAATACLLPFTGGKAIAPDQWLFPAYLLLVSFLFFGWFWTHGGQTPGMRAWKIRVVSRSGGPISWSQALIRYCGAILSLSAAGLGYWWIAFTREHKGWHDYWSNSRIDWLEPTL